MSEASTDSVPHHGPLHQFEIDPIVDFHLGGIDVSFTNSSLFMVLAISLITFFLAGGIRRKHLVPSRWQSLSEISYEFVSGMLKENVGSQGRAFFPFIFTLFMFVITCNLLGMVPYGFTVTSHIAVTFALAMVVFVGVTIVGFIIHGLHFLRFFAPSAPLPLLVLLVPVEIFSYFIRPISLSIRLGANMMAGHILLKVIAGFVVAMGIAGILPVAFMSMLVGFEIFVAILQAYIFTVLTCVYLNDAIHMH